MMNIYEESTLNFWICDAQTYETCQHQQQHVGNVHFVQPFNSEEEYRIIQSMYLAII